MKHLLIACFVLLVALQVQADEPVRVATIEQRLNEVVPLELGFRDETGDLVRLADYCSDKPVVLVLAYYKCPRLCTLVLNGLLDALKVIPYDAGKDFHVVVVSIDPQEGPSLAAEKKNTYVERYGRPGADRGWHFLTGDAESIGQLAEAVGFKYFYDERLKQYAHASGIMLLTPQGKLSRYFYGVSYSVRDLRLSLVEASSGRIGSPVDQLLLLCYSYDPATGRYAATAMNVVRLGGVVTVLTLITFLAWSWRREVSRGLRVPR